MKFADDIALGDFTSADFVEEGENSHQNARRSLPLSGLQLSFAISTALHTILVSSLFYFVTGTLETIEDATVGLIQVEFVPSNPLLAPTEVIPVSTIDETVAAETDDEREPNSLPIEEVQPENSLVNLNDFSEPEEIPLSADDEAMPSAVQAVAPISIPTVESVQNALSSLQQSDTSRFYSIDCNKLEEEKEFNNCKQSDDRDYSPLTSNPIYDFHNPAIEVSRSRQTTTTLASNSAQIAGQLELSELPSGLSGYVLEELEQSIETYSNSSVRSIDHMNTMVDKSAAGVMARRLNDSWVQQQSKLLQSRKVESRSDRKFRERCRSYEKYIMAPLEFARCLSMGESPFGFAVDF